MIISKQETLLNCLTLINTEQSIVVHLSWDIFGVSVWDYTLNSIIELGTQVVMLSRWCFRQENEKGM